MTTLQELYQAVDESDAAADAYFAARRDKVADIADYIADHIRDGLEPRKLAEAIMASAEDMGRIAGDDVSGEIARRYARDGNPLPFIV